MAKQNLGRITGETPVGRRWEFSDATDEWGITFGGIDADGKTALLFYDNGELYENVTVDQWNSEFAAEAEGYTDGKYDVLPAELRPKAKPGKPAAAKPGKPGKPKPAPEPAPEPDTDAADDTTSDDPPEDDPEPAPEPEAAVDGPETLTPEQLAAVANARNTICKCDAIAGKLGRRASEAKSAYDEAKREHAEAVEQVAAARSAFVDVWDEVASGKSGYGSLCDGVSDDDDSEPDAGNSDANNVTEAEIPESLHDVALGTIGAVKGVAPISPGRLAKLAENSIETIGDFVDYTSEGDSLDSIAGIGAKAAAKIDESIRAYVAARSVD